MLLVIDGTQVLVCTWTKAAFGPLMLEHLPCCVKQSCSRLHGGMLLGQVVRVASEKASTAL